MASLPLISVVDDDDSVRESLQRLLRSAGFAVQVFATAEQFSKSAHLHETRCLVLDVRMPAKDGFELFRELRNSHSGVPVIFITAHGNEAARSQALNEGAIDYLYKPFSEAALLGAIETALRLEAIKT